MWRMKTIYQVETLNDIKTLQLRDRAEGDDVPFVEAVVIDTRSLRVLINSDRVHHNFTPASLIQTMAEKLGINVEVK